MSRGKIKDLTGQRFGRLTVLEKTDKRTNDRHVIWKCQCDCGGIAFVSSHSLTDGKTVSCGCFLKEMRGTGKATHHMSSEKIYAAWQGMRKRCFNSKHKNYSDYGGRGITVYDEWNKDFKAFYDYVSKLPNFGEPGRTLDRIDNNGNYEPGNVRWATRKEQMNNTRKTRRTT